MGSDDAQVFFRPMIACLLRLPPPTAEKEEKDAGGTCKQHGGGFRQRGCGNQLIVKLKIGNAMQVVCDIKPLETHFGTFVLP